MFETENFDTQITSAIIEKVLERFAKVTTSGLSNPELLSIMEYVKEYWKETYRSALTSLCCEAVGGHSDSVEDASVVISLIVAGMAVHDDIIDKSIKKHLRPKKTIYGELKKNYGELNGSDNALLVGDLLIIKGLMTALEGFRENIYTKKLMDIIEILQRFIFDMYEGEFMEISCRKNLDIEVDYHIKYLWKFTADAEACARIGAILGGGSEKEVEALAEIARRFAFNFHLGEELKDSFNMEGNLKHRLKYESLPLTTLYSAKASKEIFRSEIKSIIEKSRITRKDVRKLISFGYKTGAYTYVYDIILQNTSEALKKIELLNPSLAKKALRLMIEKSVSEIEPLWNLLAHHQNSRGPP